MPLEPLKILIVDDDRTSRTFLKAVLLKRGHAVVEAGNGREAIDVYVLEKPDLILMDVVMPEMNGYEAATLIKQRSQNNFVPIIFLTALNDDESLVKCVASGGDSFLAKPVNRVLLDAKIKSMLRISQMTRELENYKLATEEEVELAQHIFDVLVKRMSVNVVPELDYWNCAAGHFSGDLMIYDKSPSGVLHLMLGDFTGHGFSAAIGAVLVSDVFFATVRQGFDTLRILGDINRKLGETMPPSYFCAAGFISFDPQTRKLQIFNGGLPPILMLDEQGRVRSRIKSSNLALGILPADQYFAELATFENIEKHSLLLYSDGVTDAQNAAGKMFGEDNVEACLKIGKKPFEAIKLALEVYIGDCPPADDISLLALNL